MGEERKVYNVLVRKTERRRSLGRPRGRWEDEIRMDLVKLAGVSCRLASNGSG
jgi:hypothetical protein